MKRKYLVLAALLSVTVISKAQSVNDGRQIISFDKSWMFFEGNAGGADKPDFKDGNGKNWMFRMIGAY